jgi:ABC-type multidrug transport system fused ATPase/permease subunit
MVSPVPRVGELPRRYLSPYWRRLALLGLLLLVGAGLRLANPQIVRVFLDETQRPQASLPTLALAGVAFLVVGLLDRATSLGSLYVGDNLGWDATNDLRANLLRHVLELDLSFHKLHSPGELIERLDGDVTALAGFFSDFTVQVVGSLLLLLGTTGFLFALSPVAGAVVVLLVIVGFGALGSLNGVVARRWAAERAASAAQYGFLEETLVALEDLRGNGAERYATKRLLDLADDYLHQNRQAQLGGSVTGGLANLLVALGYALGLGLGATLYLSGQVSLGTAYAIVAYVGALGAPLRNLRDQLLSLQRATASVGRVQALLAERPRVGAGSVGRLPDGPLAVELDRVSFAYTDEASDAPEAPGSPLVLRDVSLRVAPGRVLGLLGRTGSGKTTLIRLLARLYDPTEGSVRLGGVTVRGVAPIEIRRRVGVVTQDVQLFAASIRDNLRFFDPRVDDGAIRRALDRLGLLDWLDGLPDGLDTLLDPGGGMSAGEAQLLALARVFLRDPGLVILDEASSRLDPVTERRLERAIDGLLEGRTGVVIAHRIGTLRRADDIVVLESGQIVEFGPRLVLAADPTSRYARLSQTELTEVLA